jgi:hypothetical protein
MRPCETGPARYIAGRLVCAINIKAELARRTQLSR